LLFEKLGIEGVDIESFNEEYQAALGSVFAFLDDSLNICKALRGKVRQYAVTNGVTATQQNKLERSGLAEVMDGIFISEQVGSPKPSPVFFDYCLEHMEEKDRSRILIVGDSLTSDIKGGIQAGIATCWYHRAADGTEAGPGASCQPDYVIDDLHKVREIVLGESMEKQKGAESDAGIPV
jgi:2-haloacid dehalogenase